MTDKNIIGIDIGGTYTKAVLTDPKFSVKRKIKIRTPLSKAGFEKFFKKIPSYMGERPNKVGIAAAGVIQGTILKFAPNIPGAKNLNFHKIFPAPARVLVDNDARAFLRSAIFLNQALKNKSLGFTIGTGIGRSFAQKGTVKKIKKFEYPEKWERKYQYIRDNKTSGELAIFTADNLSEIISKYRPKSVVIGGGVVEVRKNKFIIPFKKELKKVGVSAKIFAAKKSEYSGAIGAALGFKMK